MTQIRLLAGDRDAPAVRKLYGRAADYVALETGLEPDQSTVEEFFTDCPPGGDFAQSVKVGLFMPGDRLVAIADLAFGYPSAKDAYIGLMLIEADSRGKGRGRLLLAYLVAVARSRGAERMLVAVLDENARARAFWEREG